MGWVLFAAISLAAVIYTLATMPSLRPTTQAWGQVPRAEEGLTIPVLFGTANIPSPNILWFGDVSSSPESTFDPPYVEYAAGVQFGLCHGYIDQLVAITVGGQEAYRWRHSLVYEYAPNEVLYVSPHLNDPATNDGVNGNFVLNRGYVDAVTADDGTPANRAEEYMATSTADGKIWKMRGIASLTPIVAAVMGNAPSLKPWAFRAQRIWRKNGGTEQQWYPAKAAIITGRDLGDLWKYKLTSAADAADYSGKFYDDSAWSEGRGGFGNETAGRPGQGAYDSKGNPWNSCVPKVGTCVADSTNAWTWPAGSNTMPRVIPGSKLWVRGDLGAMPYADFVVRCYHDDGATLWFNGTAVTLTPVRDTTNENSEAFNSIAYVSRSLIDVSIGCHNVLALKVTDSVPTGKATYVYAGMSVGLDASSPCATVDMNPATLLREVLTDPIWGLAIADADIDDDAFEAAADTLYDERLGVSGLWSPPQKQEEVEQFVGEILRHIDGVMYVDRTTGKVVLKLLRNDYAIPALIVLDEDSIGSVEDSTVRGTAELVNHVTVTYRRAPLGDQGCTVPLIDNGLVQQQGGIVPTKLDYPFFTNLHAANMAAQRAARVLSQPLRSCTLRNCSHAAASLQCGDAFVLDWPELGYDEVVMRVVELDIGDGVNSAVTVKCAEDTFFTPTQPIVTVGGIAWPPQVLGPAPGQTTSTKFYMVQRFDPLDRTGLAVAACFLGPHTVGGNNPMFYGLFTEVSPGVMRRNVLDPIPDSWFDDGDPVVGSTYFAWYQGDFTGNTATRYEVARQGLYRLDALGDGITEYGQFTRVDDYNTAADFVAGMTFHIDAGTLYGGKYLRLSAPVAVLGTDEQLWELLATYVPNADEALLTLRELVPQIRLLSSMFMPDGYAGENISGATMDVTVTYLGGTVDFDLDLRTKPLGLAQIPAGRWVAAFDAVWLTTDDPTATIALGCKFLRVNPAGTSVQLFEVLSSAIHNETEDPLRVAYDAPSFVLAEDEMLSLVPTIHTTSAAPVTLHLRYNNTATRGSSVTIPCASSDYKTSVTTHGYAGTRRPIEARQSGEIVVLGATTGLITVTLAAGSTVIGFASPAPRHGDLLVLEVLGATNESPIVFTHMAGVPSSAKPAYLASLSKLGTDFSEGLQVFSPRAQFAMVYNQTLGAWQLLTGAMA